MFISKKNFIILAFALFFCFVFIFQSLCVKADSEQKLSGWLWGGSDDGGSPAINTGLGWISMDSSNTGGSVSYGVNIPDTDGILSGYAWSENIGWISFNETDLIGCPDDNCSVRREGGNRLKGWARILSIKNAAAVGNSGGWEGWIKLDGSNYSVDISPGSSEENFSGYAWSDELGWIDFSRVSLTTAACVLDGTYTYSTWGECLADCDETTGTQHRDKIDSCGGVTDETQSCTTSAIPCVGQSGNWREVSPN